MYKNEYIAHYGIKGMRWGVRRFQNEDGSLTRAGKRRQISENTNKEINDLKKSGKRVGYMKRQEIKNKNTIITNITNREIKKASLTEKQSKGRRNLKITMGVVGGLVAADYVSAKLSGQPTLPQSIAAMIKVAKFAV